MKIITTNDVIISFIKMHGDRYDYSLVDYIDYKTKVKIICPVHGEFEQRADHHRNGSGCPICVNLKRGHQLRYTNTDYITNAMTIHGDRYDYSLVNYINNRIKVKIVCPMHGIFKQEANSHLQGSGCPECSGNKKKTTQQFIQDSYCVHTDTYNYKLVDYVSSKTKVNIICHLHGVFEQTPTDHTRGHGCPKCSGRIKSNTQMFIQDAYTIHGDKYEYTLVDYVNNRTKVKIICHLHGVFEQTPYHHLKRNHGCPKCASNISKHEIQLQEWIKEYIFIETNNRKLIKPYELDIIIPDKKIAIEYNGLYWHSESKGKNSKYHLNKYNLCKEQGYRLITIWENEWLFKQDIVKSIILNILGIYEEKIHARKCIIRDVLPKDARVMYNDNHIQGFKGGHHKGLYFNDELVSLLTIDKRNELQRFVNKKNTLVYGSFSKLLKSFNIKEQIYTFADTRYFTGNVYTMNGFEYVYTTKPNYYYFKGLITYHRRLFQRKNIKDRYYKGLLDYFDPNKTEYVNMLDNGFDRIWDNGNKKYIKVK